MIVNFDITKRSLMALLIVAAGLTAYAQAANKKSPPTDLVEWKSWSDMDLKSIEKLGKPLLFTVSHELSPMSKAMEIESFSNQSIADRLNSDFLPVRVDKNEHPVLSEFLFSYVQAAKQISEWPLNVITSPTLNPIEGGGYYPPTDDWGSQGLLSVVNRIAEQWAAQKEEALRKGKDNLQDMEYAYGVSSNSILPLEGNLIKLSAENLTIGYDTINAGFGLAPKAVSFKELRLLDLAVKQSESAADDWKNASQSTTNAMMFSAVRDYIRGGFFTATIEESWTIPDFRKSAIVQADAINYLHPDPKYNSVVSEIAQALISDFRSETGFYSEHVSFSDDESDVAAANTWSYKDLSRLLGKDELESFSRYFGITKEGNVSDDLDFSGVFKGRNILKPISKESPDSATLSAIQTLKTESRSKSPLIKENTSSISTNAVVASSLLKAGAGFHSEATRLLDSMLDTYWDEENRILRAATRGGQVLSTEASSKGYALFVRALLEAAEHTSEALYLAKATELQGVLDSRFLSDAGAYLIAPNINPKIPLNPHAFLENESGSANSVTLGNLLKLHKQYPDKEYRNAAKKVIECLPEDITYFPEAFSDILLGASAYEASSP